MLIISKSKLVCLTTVLMFIALAAFTIRIVYADNMKSSAEGNDIGFLEQSYDVKEVVEEEKTEMLSFDKSGPADTPVGSLSTLVGDNSTSDSGLQNSGGFAGQTVGGTEEKIDEGLGSKHSYKAWQSISKKKEDAYELIETAGMNFDGEGFGKINGRYVILCTSTFGTVGDYVDFYQEDGIIIPCIIGDIKSINNKWGNQKGKRIVDFFVDQKTWFTKEEGGNAGQKHANPGTEKCHPEWNKDLVKYVNSGSYYNSVSSTTVDGTNVLDTVSSTITEQTNSQKVAEFITLLNGYSVYFKKYGSIIKRGDGTDATWQKAYKKLKNGDTIYCNCATCINWAFREMGLMNTSNFYYKNGGGFQNISSKLDNVTKIVTKANGMTTEEAAKKGLLKYGDIIGLNVGSLQHTFVYAGMDKKGNLLNYESGGDALKAIKGKNYPNGCGPFKLGYKSHKIGSILRFTE